MGFGLKNQLFLLLSLLLVCGSAEAAQRTDRLDLIGGSSAPGRLDIYEDTDDGSNKTRIQAQAQTGDITYTLPPDDGDANEVLTTNGSGSLTWEAGGSGSPAGSDTQVQYNDAGSFGGNSAFTFTESTQTVAMGTVSITGGNGSSINATRIGNSSAANATFSALAVNSGVGTLSLTHGGSGYVLTANDTINVTAGGPVNFTTAVDINSGNIDGTKIGESSAADATFTAVNISNTLRIPNGAGGTVINQTGEIAIDSTSESVNFFDGTEEKVLQPQQQTGFSVLLPVDGDQIIFDKTDFAITMRSSDFVLLGTTATTCTIKAGTNVSGSGAFTVTSQVITSNTVGHTSTSFTDATIPADNWIWGEFSSTSGTPTSATVVLNYTIDP